MATSHEEAAMFYQAAKHFGYEIVRVNVRNRYYELTAYHKTGKAAEWKAFIEGRTAETKASRSFKLFGGTGSGSKVPDIHKTPYMRALDSMIGLENVKKQVREIASFMKIRNDRIQKKLPVFDMPMHMVFTGNPGTGKTTVARIVGEVLRETGVLDKGHFVEVSGRGLVAEYIGQTEAKARQIITEALDGILFIDEAYALVPTDSARDFGPEAVATLIKMMEDYRDRLVVIVAGYENEMEQLMNTNPGLKSRFKTKIDFPDYTAHELNGIFRQLCKEHGYEPTIDAVTSAIRLFEAMHKTKGEHFGNGRSVRNAFERTIMRQSSRLAYVRKPSQKELQTLEATDIPPLAEVSW